MLDAARAGDWAVDEETGSHLRRAPKFGNDHYAQLTADHFLQAMDARAQFGQPRTGD